MLRMVYKLNVWSNKMWVLVVELKARYRDPNSVFYTKQNSGNVSVYVLYAESKYKLKSKFEFDIT